VKGRASKQSYIQESPIVLSMMLKRFTLFGAKINKPVHVNKTIDLSKYVKKKGDEDFSGDDKVNTSHDF